MRSKKKIQMTNASTREALQRLGQIFMPHIDIEVDRFFSKRGRFVYYTTAEVAVSIIKTKQIWMRNTSTMNDSMEVHHGFECLNAAYKSDEGSQFKELLNECFPGLVDELENYFNGWLPTIRTNTYITCVSEHLDTEDSVGRLSMWRAYGGQNGVAIVVNSGAMLTDNSELGLVCYPVRYLSSRAFQEEFSSIVGRMGSDLSFLKAIPRGAVRAALFELFRASALCTKHPGFHEELEWRIMACPTMYPSAILSQHVEVVRGTPQTVLKIPLQNRPDLGLKGLALRDLIERIIVGPCEFPGVTVDAFRQLLKAARVPDPQDKVIESDIPLRSG